MYFPDKCPETEQGKFESKVFHWSSVERIQNGQQDRVCKRSATVQSQVYKWRKDSLLWTGPQESEDIIWSQDFGGDPLPYNDNCLQDHFLCLIYKRNSERYKMQWAPRVRNATSFSSISKGGTPAGIGEWVAFQVSYPTWRLTWMWDVVNCTNASSWDPLVLEYLR